MRPYHAIFAAMFLLGLAACDEPQPDGQTGELPQQQQPADPMQQPSPQPQTDDRM